MLLIYPGITFFILGNCLNFVSFGYAAQVSMIEKANFSNQLFDDMIFTYLGASRCRWNVWFLVK